MVEQLDDPWHREGSVWIGKTVRAPNGARGRVAGWLPASESGYEDESGEPASLWRIAWDDGADPNRDDELDESELIAALDDAALREANTELSAAPSDALPPPPPPRPPPPSRQPTEAAALDLADVRAALREAEAALAAAEVRRDAAEAESIANVDAQLEALSAALAATDTSDDTSRLAALEQQAAEQAELLEVNAQLCTLEREQNEIMLEQLELLHAGEDRQIAEMEALLVRARLMQAGDLDDAADEAA